MYTRDAGGYGSDFKSVTPTLSGLHAEYIYILLIGLKSSVKMSHFGSDRLTALLSNYGKLKFEYHEAGKVRLHPDVVCPS